MDRISSETLSDLRKVRDQPPLSSRLTMAGALIHETYQLFQAFPRLSDLDELREAIIGRDLLHKNSFNRRRIMWIALHHRYMTPAPRWVGGALAQAATYGNQSPEYLSLAYLYFALRDRLTFLFVTGLIWPMWQAGNTRLTHRDAMSFIRDQADEDQKANAWSETTKKRLVSSLLASLRDFGLLKGTATKTIQRPPAALETAYHLLCVLWAEGKRGRETINAPDWRLFLWSEIDIVQALTQLDQQGRVQFEKSGQTVILRLPDELAESE
jgi:hypothetical protein